MPPRRSPREPSGFTSLMPTVSLTTVQAVPAGIDPIGSPFASSVMNSSPSPPNVTLGAPATSPIRSSGSAPGVRGEGCGRPHAPARARALASPGPAGASPRPPGAPPRGGGGAPRRGAPRFPGGGPRGGPGPGGRPAPGGPRPPAVAPPRPPPADDLAECREVGSHVEPVLRPSGRDPEAGHHLVEDQQGAVPVAQRAERRVKLRLGRDEPTVPDVRLDDHRRQRVTPSPEQLAEGAGVVEGQREGETGERGGGARGVRATRRP